MSRSLRKEHNKMALNEGRETHLAFEFADAILLPVSFVKKLRISNFKATGTEITVHS